MADLTTYDHGHRDGDNPSPASNTSSSPRTFPPQPPSEQHPPRADRQPSMPRALYGGSEPSIFGSGSGGGNSRQNDSRQRQRPFLSIRSPTPTDTLDREPQSQLSALHSRSTARQFEDEIRATVDRRRLPRAEKGADDPSTPPVPAGVLENQYTATSTTLTRLFTVQAATSPDLSRTPSYLQPIPPYIRQQNRRETAALPEHLFARGLLAGRHSDITVIAFGKEYKLHRLLLDRAPFFATALSEPWLEANSKEMTVKPDEIDSSITQHAFELALKRLYGCPDVHEEDAAAIGLFATGCWLEMVDLIEICVKSILRQMRPETLATLINLVTRNYYGRAGDRILASAKAMLCRDGWRMPLRYWDGVPADIAREIIGGDGFYIDGELERWVLSKRIVDRRLRARAVEAGLHEAGNRRKILRAPASLATMAIRFDSVSRRSAPAAFSPGVPDSVAEYVALYTHPSIEPLLVLLDEGIHYMHLDFEQLQYIRQARDVLGLPVMLEKVVSKALWQQMELRQRVVNARDGDLELGLAVQATEEHAGGDRTMSISNPATPYEEKGKQRADPMNTTAVRDFEETAGDEDHDSQSWDGTGRPRKFWIPSRDCHTVMGGASDAVVATPSSDQADRYSGRYSLQSVVLDVEDVPWASDFATGGLPRSGASDGAAESPPPAVSYSHLPPFRFSAEFPAPRLLKDDKRIYSRTVFYAGSLWNIYIQKIASARHTKQLGVYLHRAKERETEEVVYGTPSQASVEGRIDLLERGMLPGTITRDERRRLRRQTIVDSFRPDHEAEESSGSAGDLDSALAAAMSENSQPGASSSRPHRHSTSPRKTGQTSNLTSPFTPSYPSDHLSPHPSSPSSSEEDSDSSHSPLRPLPPPTTKPTLPPYIDTRPNIMTYFKIYSPSRGGRMLSVFESARDSFKLSKSWGWKSSTLMLDEGFIGEGEVRELGVLEREGEGREERGQRDGKLRFMVVVGNI